MNLRSTGSVGLSARSSGTCDPGPRIAPHHSVQAQLTHQPRHPLPAGFDVLAVQLPPDLLDAVHPEVVGVYSLDLLLQAGIAPASTRKRPGDGSVVSGGAISSTWQIGSTPKAFLFAST
jgi:hypothetical protein